MSYNEETVIKEVKNFMESVGVNYFPTFPMLKNVVGLNTRVTKVGGSTYLSKKYNIPTKRSMCSIKITDEEINTMILKVVSDLNIDRFPTRDEMNRYSGSSSLSGLISRRGGFIKWSKLTNLEMKQSETLVGYKGESILSETVSSKGYKIERQTANCLYDFIIDDNVRVDCKYSHLYHGDNGSFYAFNLESKMHDCDLFILICEDDDKNKNVIIIPQSFVQNQGQISVGQYKSKWYKYIDKYEYVDMYINFYKTLNNSK